MERLPMPRVREFLRLRWVLRLGVRQAAATAGVGRRVVSEASGRAEHGGLHSWKPLWRSRARKRLALPQLGVGPASARGIARSAATTLQFRSHVARRQLQALT